MSGLERLGQIVDSHNVRREDSIAVTAFAISKEEIAEICSGKSGLDIFDGIEGLVGLLKSHDTNGLSKEQATAPERLSWFGSNDGADASRKAKVFRDGCPVELPAPQLVVGDLIVLTPGDEALVDCLAVTPVTIDGSIVQPGGYVAAGKKASDEAKLIVASVGK
eukprot:TRINITY_DN9122_c0_g1_i1.p1 TRINITY_DN9122_c0_g1~~TRINITY_DN9122_c0_g1_i1.p1  ORF type:complete len:164 (+),score=30.54 TRINITY_DN9122_c0_g1_i1:49-540(+)